MLFAFLSSIFTSHQQQTTLAALFPFSNTSLRIQPDIKPHNLPLETYQDELSKQENGIPIPAPPALPRLTTDPFQATPGYKPSPLSHGNSIRNSPFRRRDSAASPQSSPLRQTTPLSSPIKFDKHDSPSRPQPERASSGETATPPVSTPPVSTPPVGTPPASTPPPISTPSASTAPIGAQPTSWTPKARTTSDEMPGSASQASTARAAPLTNTMAAHGTALSQLQPSQVRNLRDGFQILDRDSDGVVNREDVADMLNQLGTTPLCPLSHPPLHKSYTYGILTPHQASHRHPQMSPSSSPPPTPQQ